MTGRRPGIHAAVAAVVLAAAAPTAPNSLAAHPPPDLHGPLSDFWERVKSDWSRRITGLNHGPTQTAIWIAMIWDGPESLAIDRIVDSLHEREARRWVRSQITRHRWSRIAARDLKRMQALRHNIILVGTPDDNQLIARALEATPIRVSRGSVSIGRRRIEGDGLLVVCIAPNPVNPRSYALVMTGTSSSALLEAGEAPYGETDYIVFRGRKVLDRGFFTWRDGSPRRDGVARSQSFSERFNRRSLASTHHRLHFDPSSTPDPEMRRLGAELDLELEQAAAFYGIRPDAIDPIDCYLYVSREEKVSQTADARLAHLDRAGTAIHAVHGGSLRAADSALAVRILLRRASGRWGEQAERELPGLAFALSLAWRELFQGRTLVEWARRSRRDPGYLPMDLLLSRVPRELESGELSALDAAAFVRDVIAREGSDRVALLYRTARRSDLHERFREIFGRSLRQAEQRWLGAVRDQAPLPVGPQPAAVGAPSTATARDLEVARSDFMSRDDISAERLLQEIPRTAAARTLLARVYFRTGRFEQAARTAEEALALPDGSAEERAWARLTLGRSHAKAGRTVAALSELKEADISRGPEQVRILADYWLETMGQPLDRRAAHQLMMHEAGADLINFRWEDAEKKLQTLLAGDPENQQAHALLGQVYLSKYRYWYDYILLDSELFPGSGTDPNLFANLASKGREELRRAGMLPPVEEGLWMSETGPGEPGSDTPMARYMLGRIHYQKGEMEAARRELEAALALQPRSADLAAYCHLYLGRIAAAEGDFDEARRRFQSAQKMRAGQKVSALAKEALRMLRDPADAP